MQLILIFDYSSTNSYVRCVLRSIYIFVFTKLRINEIYSFSNDTCQAWASQPPKYKNVEQKQSIIFFHSFEENNEKNYIV